MKREVISMSASLKELGLFLPGSWKSDSKLSISLTHYFCFLKINLTFYVVSPVFINSFEQILNLHEAETLLFKTYLVLLQCVRQRYLQAPRSRPLGFVTQITCNLCYKTCKSLKIDDYVIRTPIF